MSAPNYDQVRMPEPVPGRPAYVPEWSPTFSREDLARQVRYQGVELGFTVAEVMPERRWAITPETGELIEIRRFSELYQSWKSKVFAGGQLRSVGEENALFDPTAVAVPEIRHFVDAKLDQDGREIPIRFDPEAPAPAKAERVLYDHQGEVAKSVREALAPARVTAQLELLTQQYLEGQWTREQYAHAVARLTQKADAEPAAPTTLPEGFDAIRSEPEPEPEPPVWMADCGFEARSAAGLSGHQRFCPKCKGEAA